MIAISCSARIAPPAIATNKHVATLRARAALAGAHLVVIEGDDGGAELLLTRGATTQRFHDLGTARAAIVPGEMPA